MRATGQNPASSDPGAAFGFDWNQARFNQMAASGAKRLVSKAQTGETWRHTDGRRIQRLAVPTQRNLPSHRSPAQP
jgi:hypothetical protein